jgi:hypothetical protein
MEMEAHATEQRTTTPTALTIPEERAQLTERAQAVTDPAEAERLERRLLTLEAAERIAQARARAEWRRQEREAAQRARASFDALVPDVREEFRARAAAIDTWMREGAVVMANYRVTLARLAEFAPMLRLGPRPQPGHEMDLLTRGDKLALSRLLEHELAVTGVLDDRAPAAQRDSSLVFEDYVLRQLQAFVDVAHSWLPPAAHTDHESATNDDSDQKLARDESA